MKILNIERKRADFKMLAIADVLIGQVNGVSVVFSHQFGYECKNGLHNFRDAFGNNYLISDGYYPTSEESQNYWHYVNNHGWGKR